ncbi:MAG TPA: replication protein C, partial [Methanocorpusculum sp.]|nr:replication protein C [Methanocorpusculum sp.]
ESVLYNFKQIVKWYTSLKPLSNDFRLIIFDCAGELPIDAQAALRRIMERYSKTCRFIFITKFMSSIIDPIRSRCVPLYYTSIPKDLMIQLLKKILSQESLLDKVSDDTLEMISLCSKGDLRLAIVWLELIAVHGVTNFDDLISNEPTNLASEIIKMVNNNKYESAHRITEDLMVEYGLSASAVLNLIRNELLRDSMTPDTALLIADSDMAIHHGSNEYIQINAFITHLITQMHKN